jgi:hypothetical protein
MDWLITIPKTVEWKDWMAEVNHALKNKGVLNYHVRFYPKGMSPGDRVFVVWNGFVRGWMECVGAFHHTREWKCRTTGKTWPAGVYIQRGGPFHPVFPVAYPGFRGIRRVPKETVELWKMRDEICPV